MNKDATGSLLKLIGMSMDAWRGQAIGDLIKKSNGDVQTIASFLAATANAIEKADKLAMSVSDRITGRRRERSLRILALRGYCCAPSVKMTRSMPPE